MKRFRLLIITTLLALSTSFSAFAGSWEEDSKGWYIKTMTDPIPVPLGLPLLQPVSNIISTMKALLVNTTTSTVIR